MARKTASTSPVETLKHKDKRVNIPTQELREFVADAEKSPYVSCSKLSGGGALHVGC